MNNFKHRVMAFTLAVAITAGPIPPIVFATETSGGTTTTVKKEGVTVNVDIVETDNANTVIMDLVKLNFKGLPYEFEAMRKYLNELPEYKYGDIVDTVETPTSMTGRQYFEYEEPLIRDGIIRQLSDIEYNDFNWTKSNIFSFSLNDSIKKTYFLASLARQAGMKDNVYASARSTVNWILDNNFTQTKFRGRQPIELSPYQKDVQGQVDIGTSIVLVDYSDREYNIFKLDNIYKPYLKYLLDIGVADESDFNEESFDMLKSVGVNSEYELIRVNYNNIPVSRFVKNENSTKDFTWDEEQVDLKDYGGGKDQYENYQLTYSNGALQEYNIEGGLLSSYYKLKAKVPSYMVSETMTVLDALTYIYKYMWYNEEEPVLNNLEVDAVMSLYGLKLANYTEDEKKVLKYLIAKGVVNPDEDNLELMRKPLLYKDVLKYLYRLNYADKRFDFKSVTLSSDDIRLAREGYSQDAITYYSNSESLNLELEKAKKDALELALSIEKTLGYSRIFLKIPGQEYVNSNYILSSEKDLEAVFTVSAIKDGGYAYGQAMIPNSFTDNLVLRSTALEGGYKIVLDEWENNGIYEANGDSGVFKKIGTYQESDDTASIQLNRFAAGNSVKIAIDKEKSYLYNGVEVFQGSAGSRALNPDLADLFTLDGTGLILKDVSTWAQAEPIVKRFTVPPGLSSDELTFMGYSQLTVNGEKITMIKDTDMNKLGIEVIEDNVLYNRKLDLYGYLDLRTSRLYYGNTVVKYQNGTLIVEGVENTESTFYNLDIVKTMLTNVGSNNGLTNEVLTVLPADESITVVDKDGALYDYIYMHPNDEKNRSGDWWINASTLSKKNSNVIFFRDAENDLSLLINFRARVLKEDDTTNNNNFGLLLDNLKSRTMNSHPGMNSLLESIIGYKGKYSIYDYNYGITLMYDENSTESTSNAQFVKEHALNALWNMFETEADRDTFVGCLHSDADFAGIKLPSRITKSVDPTVDSHQVVKIDTFSKLYSYMKNNVPSDIQSTLFLSAQKVEQMDLGQQALSQVDSTLPAKIINNNLYFRFKNFNSFLDISIKSPYRFLDSLIFLYEMNYDSEILKMKYEKVNYENTPTGYIPLENWNNLNSIGNWTYIGKTSIDLKDAQNNTQAFIFDKIKPTVGTGADIKVTYTPSSTTSKAKFMEELFKNILNSNSNMKEAWSHSDVKDMIALGHGNYEENLKSVLLEMIPTGVWGTNNTDVRNYLRGLSTKAPTKEIKLAIDYTYPAGTMLVNVGNDYAGELKSKSNNYTLQFSINPRPRTTLGNSFDLINQNISQLNSENTTVGQIPVGSTLILPSNVEAYAVGDSRFIIMDGQSLSEGVDSEAVLMWKYLNVLNVRAGSSLVLLNGIKEIKLPSREDITGNSLEKFNDLIKTGYLSNTYKLAYRDGGVIKTGTLNTSKKTITEDTDGVVDSNAKIFPMITIDDSMTSVLVMNDNSEHGVYMIKDVSSSINTELVDYLRAGIVDVNTPSFDETSATLGGLQSDSGEIENSKMKTLLILMSKIYQTIRYAIPAILFLYSVSCLIFLTAFSISLTRNFIFNVLPDNVAIAMFRIFSLFSVDEMYDMNIPLGFVKGTILLALSIVWWNILL